MSDIEQKQIDYWTERLNNHQLTQITDTAKIKAYYLHDKPLNESRMMSTLIMFTPEGIIICGDLCPKHGVVSDLGYGAKWFSSSLSPDYLAEKFLKDDVYESERAKQDYECWLNGQNETYQ